jgi:hypothetical protein
MRAFVIAVIMLAGSSSSSLAVVRVGAPNECSDRNALQDIAVDARLTAIQFYYKGLIQTSRTRTGKSATKRMFSWMTASLSSTGRAR